MLYFAPSLLIIQTYLGHNPPHTLLPQRSMSVSVSFFLFSETVTIPPKRRGADILIFILLDTKQASGPLRLIAFFPPGRCWWVGGRRRGRVGRMGSMGGGGRAGRRGARQERGGRGEKGVMQIIGSVHLIERGGFRGEREKKTSNHDGYIVLLISYCFCFHGSLSFASSSLFHR